MGPSAYLAPVGPFAGLSNCARRRIAEAYPALAIAEVERAAENFTLELQTAATELRLAEARTELETFSQEVARFQGAVDRLRSHGLEAAVGEASRMVGAERALERIQCLLQVLRGASKRTARSVPAGCAQLAARKLVAALADQLAQAGRSVNGASTGELYAVIDLIFDDLMVGGDPRGAVSDWRKCQGEGSEQDPVATLADLVLG